MAAANSPDLNTIEFVWQVMKKKIQEVHPTTLNDMKSCIQEVWDSLSPEELHEMVSSMPRRIRAVIDKKGDFAQY